MKASAPPWVLGVAAAAILAALPASAQDTVVLSNNQRREGTILGVSGDQLKIKIGPAATTLPMNQVTAVTMAPPKAFNDALAAWQKGDAAGTLQLLKPLVDNFRGLPAPWAERASALLGEVYLSQDNLAAAEAAFADFQKIYPKAASLSDIGLARLAVSKKDYAGARRKLEPILAEAEKVTIAPTGQSAAFGQAYYLMGTVHEAEGRLPEALQDYLTAVTLFSEDQAVVAKARQRADVLINEKQILVP